MEHSYEIGFKKLFPTFAFHFEENVKRALASGAVSEEMMANHSYAVYKAVLIITAENYFTDTKVGIETLKNLRNFI